MNLTIARWTLEDDRELPIYRNPTDGDDPSPQKLTSGTIFPLAFPNVAIALETTHQLR